MLERQLFDRLRLILAFELEAVRHRVDELGAQEYPSNVADRVSDEIRLRLLHQNERLKLISSIYDQDAKGAVEQLRSEHRKLRTLLPYLDILERAQTSRVPWSLVPFFESISDKLTKTPILTSSASEFNYGLDEEGRPQYGANTLYLPQLQRSNALLHVLVGHELFHPAVEAFVDERRAAVLENLKEPCADLAARSRELSEKHPQEADLFTPSHSEFRPDRLVSVCAEIWRRGTTEILCDLGCAALFGPGALQAIATYGICAGLDDQPSPDLWYPPTRMRIREVLRLGFDELPGKDHLAQLMSCLSRPGSDKPNNRIAERLSAELSSIRGLAAEPFDKTQISKSQILSLAYQEVLRHLEDGHRFVLAKVNESGIEPWHAHIETIPHLVRLFDSRVPACEVRGPGDWKGRASNPFAVFVAAWLCQLKVEHEEDGTDLEDYLARCRLLFKSVEDSELKRAFELRKEEHVS